MRQPRLVAVGERVVPAGVAMADRYELTLMLATERSARPAAGNQAIQLALKHRARPLVAVLLQLVEFPQRLLPAVLFALEAAQQHAQLRVLPVHRAEDETDLVEDRRRQHPHPELLGAEIGVGALVGAPGRPVALVEQPHTRAAMRSTLALHLAVGVDPLVAGEPIVMGERRVARPAVPVTERGLLPADVIRLIAILLPCALREADDVQLADLRAPQRLGVERPERELLVGLPLLGPGVAVPAGGLALEIREVLSAAALRQEIGAQHQRLAGAAAADVLRLVERRRSAAALQEVEPFLLDGDNAVVLQQPGQELQPQPPQQS